MSQIRFLTSSDEHLSDVAPGFRKDDYRNAILSKIRYQGLIGNKSNINALLRGGDFFHHKAANRTTHSTIQLTADIHKEFQFPTYALAGNHDMSNNQLESVFSQQPLGVLYKTGVFSRLNDTIFESGSLKCRVVGVDFTPDMGFDDLSRLVQKREDDGYVIAVVHALAEHNPKDKTSEFFHETVFDYRDLVFNNCPDVYVFGHYHKDQGIQEVMGTKFVNLGSISRGSLTFENLNRTPKSSLITINSQGISIEEVPMECADSVDIFDLETKNKMDKERKSIDDFINKLKTDAVQGDFNIATFVSNLPDEVRVVAQQIIDAAEAGVLEV